MNKKLCLNIHAVCRHFYGFIGQDLLTGKSIWGREQHGYLFVEMFSQSDDFIMNFKLNKKNCCSIRFVIII